MADAAAYGLARSESARREALTVRRHVQVPARTGQGGAPPEETYKSHFIKLE
jgi:hypothetical protein